MNKLVNSFFKKRGYTNDFLQKINQFPTQKLMNVEILADRLQDYYLNQDLIVIISDFDMDGIMSGVVAYSGLSELGFNTALYIPNVEKGYGFNEYDINRIIQDYPNVKAILTCDVGTSCYEGVEYAREKNLEVFITDHHREGMYRPNASIMINPMATGENYLHPEICGAFVMYKCLEEYTNKFQFNKLRNIELLKLFAGIATIADMMPVLYENRALIKDSVNIAKLLYGENDNYILNLDVSNNLKTALLGIYNILALYTKEGELKSSDSIDEKFYGFYLAPLFNSIKRLNVDIDLAFSIFYTNGSKHKVDKLFELNELRKTKVDEYMDQIFSQENLYEPFVYFCDAPAGFLGLLANKIMRLSGIVTLVINKDEDGYMSGSGRSPMWYPAMSRLSTNGFKAAGHNNAFGINIQDDDELNAIVEFLKKDTEEYYELVKDDIVESDYDYHISTYNDGLTNIDIDMFMDYVNIMSQFKPYGVGFESAKGRVSFDINEAKIVKMGKLKNHVKFILRDGFEVICWNSAYLLDDVELGVYKSRMEVYGDLSINDFNNNISVNFIGDLVLEPNDGIGIDIEIEGVEVYDF